MALANTVRQPAVADRFYPGEAAPLQSLMDGLFSAAEAPSDAAPKAVIAPHAGFLFSGAVAATAYRQLEPAAGRIERVVILGPAHFHPVRGLAAHSARRFATPLGDMAVDEEAMATVLERPDVGIDDRAHAREHSLETQLPFIRHVLGEVRIVPLVVGEASPEAVAEILEGLWGGPETAIVISSDLSHFHPDRQARRLDRATAEAVERLDGEALGPQNACGFLPIGGLLGNVRRRAGRVQTLALRTSADAGAPADRVVGYGAFSYREARA